MNPPTIKHRPILMSAPMVRATLNTAPDTMPPVAIDDSLPFKWQTRRVMNPQPTNCGLLYLDGKQISEGEYYVWAGHKRITESWEGEKGGTVFDSPYGRVGQRLWVREAFARFSHGGIAYASGEGGCQQYAINYNDPNGRLAYRATDGHREGLQDLKWKPSIHMPRWASRLTLEITGVRVERIQHISEEDAHAEGVPAWHDGANGTTYIGEFQLLWDSINAKRDDGVYSWERNPWVWVIEYKRIGGQG